MELCVLEMVLNSKVANRLVMNKKSSLAIYARSATHLDQSNDIVQHEVVRFYYSVSSYNFWLYMH